MDIDRTAQLLAGTEMFGKLDDADRQRLAERAVPRRLVKGQTVFLQGEPGDSLYVVLEGLIKVFVTSSDGDEMVLTTLRPPDVFGELTVLDGGDRSASASAVVQSLLVSLDRNAVLDVIGRDPKPIDDLLRAIGGLLRRLTSQTSDLVFLDLHGRVAKLLVELAERDGVERDRSLVLDLELTQSDLAEMVGGSRQSVNEILGSFDRRGMLEVKGREISIQDMAGLRRRGGL